MNFLKKIDIYYIITLLFLLISTPSNFLGASNLCWILMIIFILATAIVRKSINKKELNFIGILSLVYLAFVSIRDILVNSLTIDFLITDIVFLFKYILLSYVFIITLKEKAISYIVKVMVHFTVVSFFFYFLQVLGLGRELYNFANSLNLPPPGYNDEGYANFVLFSITLNRHDYSNSGFLWEPGVFGCYLILAILFNLFTNKLRVNRNLIILVIGAITTFSTTTFLALFIVMWTIYRYNVPKLNRWLLLIIPVVIILFITVPILGVKILLAYNEDMIDLTKLNTLQRFYHKQHTQIPLNRFASIVFVFDNFGEKLILGVSNQYDVLLNKKNDVVISNGIPDIMARFGLVSLIFIFYRYIQFCSNYLKKNELLIYCGVILFVLSFGEPILTIPICLIFLFLPLVQGKTTKAVGNQQRGVVI